MASSVGSPVSSLPLQVGSKYNIRLRVSSNVHIIICKQKDFQIESLPKSVSSKRSSTRPTPKSGGRRVFLRSCEIAALAAIFKFGGTKPDYIGVQKNPPSLALCPATPNCISTAEELNDVSHYVPPWNYNGPERKRPVTKEEAMSELLDVIRSTKPDNYTPRIVEKTSDYVYVEYESPILGLVDDVEFWFPPGKESIVEYRSASRFGNVDFDVNRKRIKALRLQLEKRGWEAVLD